MDPTEQEPELLRSPEIFVGLELLELTEDWETLELELEELPQAESE
ncbi:hypothetical protein [Limnothrix sp. PR1529]|nr:hypothetical protein [Limnothrix sp. PR1529]